MCGIKSGTLKCRRRAVLMLLNLEEPFYHCSCRAFLSFFLSLVYPENAALRWKSLICDLLTGPQMAQLSGAHQKPALEVGKKPGVADPMKWSTSHLWEETAIHDMKHWREELWLVFGHVGQLLSQQQLSVVSETNLFCAWKGSRSPWVSICQVRIIPGPPRGESAAIGAARLNCGGKA